MQYRSYRSCYSDHPQIGSVVFGGCNVKSQKVGGSGRGLLRAAHDHARRHDRERRAALHPARPGLLPGRLDLGGQRLPHRLRQLSARGGKDGDLIGRRKVFLAGVFLFTVASVGTGFATGGQNLIVGRFLQGLGGSLSAGVIIAIIVTEFQEPAERAQAMSVFTLVIAGGGSLGLLAGGLLTQWMNWHWIFFINLPIGILTLLLGAWLIEENEGLGLSQGVDLAGAVLITASLMLGVYGIVTAADYGWTSAHTLGFTGAAVGLGALFVLLESRLRNPLMPLRIVGIRSLTGASGARALLFTGLFT